MHQGSSRSQFTSTGRLYHTNLYLEIIYTHNTSYKKTYLRDTSKLLNTMVRLVWSVLGRISLWVCIVALHLPPINQSPIILASQNVCCFVLFCVVLYVIISWIFVHCFSITIFSVTWCVTSWFLRSLTTITNSFFPPTIRLCTLVENQRTRV